MKNYILVFSLIFVSAVAHGDYGSDQIALADFHICKGLIKVEQSVPEGIVAQRRYGNSTDKALYEKLGNNVSEQLESLDCRNKLHDYRTTCDALMARKATLEARRAGYFEEGSAQEKENTANLKKVEKEVYSLECDRN